MSGQPSGNPSAPRPTTNGVGAAGMSSSQQRTDPQVGSSTSNGQSGSMSQSNLNSIVRQKTIMLLSVCFESVKKSLLAFFRIFCPREQRRFDYDRGRSLLGDTITFLYQPEVPPFKTRKTYLLARCHCRALHQHLKS